MTRKYRALTKKFLIELSETTDQELFERISNSLTVNQYRKWLAVRTVLNITPIRPWETSEGLVRKFKAAERMSGGAGVVA